MTMSSKCYDRDASSNSDNCLSHRNVRCTKKTMRLRRNSVPTFLHRYWYVLVLWLVVDLPGSWRLPSVHAFSPTASCSAVGQQHSTIGSSCCSHYRHPMIQSPIVLQHNHLGLNSYHHRYHYRKGFLVATCGSKRPHDKDNSKNDSHSNDEMDEKNNEDIDLDMNTDYYKNSNNPMNMPVEENLFLVHKDSIPDPQVIKKKNKKNGNVGYQPMDNRDQLPFVVQVVTPDPYTNRQVLRDNARQRTKEEKKKKKPTSSTNSHNLSNNNNKSGQLSSSIPLSSMQIHSNNKHNHNNMASSLLQLQQPDGAAPILLGEFALDKSTTTGDGILIGTIEYKVTSAKCQYKYAGGKRFVMVRKILQVKEVRRMEQEAQLLRQLQLPMTTTTTTTTTSPPSSSGDNYGNGGGLWGEIH